MGNKVEAFLEDVTNYMAAQTDCTCLILAGSYASGRATENSDIDLLIFTNNRSKISQSIELAKRIRHYSKLQFRRIWHCLSHKSFLQQWL